MSQLILASQKMFVKIVGFIKESVTTWTPKPFGEVICIIWMNDMIIESL